MLDVGEYGLEPNSPRKWKAGQVFNQWTILGTGTKPGSTLTFAVAQCSCGSDAKLVKLGNITSGKSKNCGCGRLHHLTTHGLSYHPLYRIWYMIIDRCKNPKCSAFPNYGGRGITVCNRWLDLHAFIADMADGYKKGLDIDRIDNSRGYEPGNCHWVTRLKNNRNRRCAVHLTYNGFTLPLMEWAKITGIKYETLLKRRAKGWDDARTLTQPVT